MNSLIDNLSAFPISFKYGDAAYIGISDDFVVDEQFCRDFADRKETFCRLIHADRLLQLEIRYSEYLRHSAYEYTVYYTNIGCRDTEILSDVCSLNIKLKGDNPVLKGMRGDGGGLYAPFEKTLTDETAVFVSDSGRPTHLHFPYYDFEYGNRSLMFTIGWPGCWESSFTPDGDKETVSVKAGLHGFESRLKPGETVRTPLMAFVLDDGRDGRTAVNAWRKWYLDCVIPHKNGRPFNTVLTAGSNRMTELMVRATDDNQIDIMRSFFDHGIKLDYWWMDAGWYTDARGETINSWWQTGSLAMDRGKFPTGLSGITKAAAENGCETLLWFEPEWFRIDLEEYKERTPDFDPSWLIMRDGAWTKTGHPWYLFNLGIPECRKWLLSHIKNIISVSGVSVYRQDFNADPGPSWRFRDEQEGPDRKGITENLYVQGYLELWDSILEAFPGIVIDSCASGGGRNDLETMRRSVPFTRTDYDYCDYNNRQAMIQSLSKWLPYNGNIGPTMEYAHIADGYGLRSSYCACLMMTYNVYAEGFDWDVLTAKSREFREIKDCILADYYELLPWSNKDDVWRGWEYFDPEKQEGFIQLFRAENSGTERQSIGIFGVDESKMYELSDSDGINSRVVSGEALIRGCEFILPEPRSSAVIKIKGL